MKIKNELIIGFVGTVVVFTAVVFLGQEYRVRTASTPPVENMVNSVNGSIAEVSLTVEEIAKHNTVRDCWMIINRKVYSVGSYASAHPGGEQAIVSFCGKDGTTAFDTKGGGDGHSRNAVGILASFLIGDLGSKTSVSNVRATEQKAQTLPALKDREYDD